MQYLQIPISQLGILSDYIIYSQLNALLPDDPDKSTWLLHLADVLSGGWIEKAI